jgi:glycosyl-4,4'-diaponeurosporenoate acyltransferase
MLIELPILWTVIINFVIWFIIHMTMAYIITMIPANWINVKSSLYQEKAFENAGKIYETHFKIKSWKELLPDGAALFDKGFKKKRLVSFEESYIQQFVLETCRGELAHWLVIAFSPIFFIWNPLWAGCVMIIYALLANLHCIITQRYNRIRFNKILDRRRF